MNANDARFLRNNVINAGKNVSYAVESVALKLDVNPLLLVLTPIGKNIFLPFVVTEGQGKSVVFDHLGGFCVEARLIINVPVNIESNSA